MPTAFAYCLRSPPYASRTPKPGMRRVPYDNQKAPYDDNADVKACEQIHTRQLSREGERKKKSPVAAKRSPRGNAHIPARSWASPPAKRAIPSTTLGSTMFLVPALYIERMNVVVAKE
jgi:hypothetical protein